MFASRGILEHLGRGVVGIGSLTFCALFASAHPWLSLAFIPLGVVALRGCPMCWTVGLVQTIAAKLQRKSTDELCADGSCAYRARSRASA